MFNSFLIPLLLIAATFSLVLLNGVFVAAEFAIVRVRRTRLEELSGEGLEAARNAIVVVDGMGDYLALTQVGITVASLGVGWLAENVAVQLLNAILPANYHSNGLLHAIGIATAFVVVTAVHVLFGEQIPKLLAVSRAEPYLLVIARRFYGLSNARRVGFCIEWDTELPAIRHSRKTNSN